MEEEEEEEGMECACENVLALRPDVFMQKFLQLTCYVITVISCIIVIIMMIAIDCKFSQHVLFTILSCLFNHKFLSSASPAVPSFIN